MHEVERAAALSHARGVPVSASWYSLRPPPVAGRVAMVGGEAPVLAARPLGLGRVKGHDVAGVRAAGARRRTPTSTARCTRSSAAACRPFSPRSGRATRGHACKATRATRAAAVVIFSRLSPLFYVGLAKTASAFSITVLEIISSLTCETQAGSGLKTHIIYQVQNHITWYYCVIGCATRACSRLLSPPSM